LGHGARATGLDQLPESLLPALVCRKALSLTMTDIAAICVLFFLSEILISRILFKAHLREHPY
jgi:CDP-2,3-bis-(O-geranylgeranyl)-sn-glycerol synthase